MTKNQECKAIGIRHLQPNIVAPDELLIILLTGFVVIKVFHPLKGVITAKIESKRRNKIIEDIK